MRTVLDDVRNWLLESLTYDGGRLTARIAAMKPGEPEDIRIGKTTVSSGRPLETHDDSPRYIVTFDQVIAWQVVDEYFNTGDGAGYVGDTDGILRAFTRSPWLDHIEQHHGWFRDTRPPASQHSLITVNEIVDVIACEAPVIDAVGRG